jgi:hypothetical protein
MHHDMPERSIACRYDGLRYCPGAWRGGFRLYSGSYQDHVPYVAHKGYMSPERRYMYMGKTATIRARVEPELKRGAEAVLKKIGLT